MKIKNKFLIKLPKNTNTLYETNSNLLLIKKGGIVKSVIPELRIVILKNEHNTFIYVTDVFSKNTSASKKKKLGSIRGKTCSTIKIKLLEINTALSQKLKLVGVGFRALNELPNSFTFKLGYSHSVFYKLPDSIKAYCKKHIRITLFGKTSYSFMSEVASNIRSLKKPEPYKGKGILYETEVVNLKQGKKV